MSFDPYHAWLDIPPGERPPNHYVLLGLPLYESDQKLIEDAAKSRVEQVRSRATWEHSAETQAVITQLHRARCLLTHSVRKAFYDLSLRAGQPHEDADSASEQPLTLDPEFTAASDFAAAPDFTAAEEDANRVDEEHVDHWHPFPVGDRRDVAEQTADAATLSLHDSSGLIPARGSVGHEKLTASPQRSNELKNAWFSSRPRTAAAIVSIAAIVAVSVLLVQRLGRNEDNSPNGQVVQISEVGVESDDYSPISSQHARDLGERDGVSPAVIARHADSPGGLRHPARQDLVAAEQPAEPAVTPSVEQLVSATAKPDEVPLPEADKTEQTVSRSSLDTKTAAPTPAASESHPATLALNAAPAPPLHEIPNVADRGQYVKLMRDMLHEGFLPDSRALPGAAKHFDVAQRIFKRDPSLYLCYGLVLWRHLKYDEALTQFEASTRTGEGLYVPGWQASIRAALARKHTETALAQLPELSRLLSRHAADASNAESFQQCSEWIGRIVGYLEQPTNTLVTDLDVVADCRRQIQEVLRDEFLHRFEKGRGDVAREYAENMNAAERAVSELEDEQKAQREQTQRTLAKKIDAGEDQAEALTRTANEWKDWIDGQTRELDQQLGKLADEFQKTFHQAQAVSTAIDRANSEIFSREQQAASRQAAVKLPDSTLTSLAKRRDELRTQYDLLERQGTQLQQQGTATLEKRRQAVAAYQKATGKLFEESETLRKWQDTLTKQSRRPQNQALPGAAKANALKRHATALTTYVDFDLEIEKDRLLAAFSQLQNP